MLDLSVVIVSFNTRHHLEACLASLFTSLRPPASSIQAEVGSTEPSSRAQAEGLAEVFVADNASTDGSADMVRERFPQVHLIENRENLGFAAANNQAIRQSQGRYILLLNPDTIVRGDAVAALIDFMEANPQAGVAGAKLLYPDGRLQHSAFAFPTLPMAFFDFFPLNHRLINSRLNGRYPRHWYDRPFPIDHPLGACFMVRREVIDQVGLFDERFFIYCEEIDWCIRIKEAGWQIYCVPAAEVVHHAAQSTGQFRDQMFVQLWKSRYQLFAKHYGLFYQRAVRWIVRLGLLRQMMHARWQSWRGEMSPGELQGRLAAYGRVFRM